MPELPDVTVYVEALERHVVGHVAEGVQLLQPFFLRTVDPPLEELAGRTITGARRIAKRVVLAFEGDVFAVVHLMIAGRLYWRGRGSRPPRRVGLLAIDLDDGTLQVTEASSKKRASLHVVRGADALAGFEPGGVDPMEATKAEFTEALRRENRTLKRALTDQRIVAGIGNAYSDEVLHRARTSPFKRTGDMADDEFAVLFDATQAVLGEWTRRLREEAGEGWPDKVTAFREGMAVHGRYREPCPDCGTPVQRIRYVDRNDMNYCPTCQTDGKLLADRSLSRLYRGEFPKTLEELEAGYADPRT